jgi:DNA-binding transcriptional LysR family regulator
LRERGSGTREVVEQLLTSQLGEIRLTMELGGTEAIKRAVEAGIGISCLPTIALSGSVELGNLVVIATPFLRLARTMHILLHRQKYRTEGMESLLRLCRDAAAGSR